MNQQIFLSKVFAKKEKIILIFAFCVINYLARFRLLLYRKPIVRFLLDKLVLVFGFLFDIVLLVVVGQSNRLVFYNRKIFVKFLRTCAICCLDVLSVDVMHIVIDIINVDANKVLVLKSLK